MKRNTLLSLATAVGKIFTFFLVIAFVVLTGFFLHYQIQPQKYQGVVVNAKSREFIYKSIENSTYVSGKTKTTQILKTGIGERGDGAGGNKLIPLGEVSYVTLYYLYFQTVVSLVLLLFITAEVLKIIKSVRVLDTFRKGNVQSFRRIGFVCLVFAMVNCHSVFISEQHSSSSFSLEAVPLLFMLGAFIMAEIFKEGNKLFEQEQLTI